MISLSDAQPSQNHLTILLLILSSPVTERKAQLILPQYLRSVHNESFLRKSHLETPICKRDSLRNKTKRSHLTLSSTTSFSSKEKYYHQKLALTSSSSFGNFHRQENFQKEVMIVSNILGIIIGVVVIIVGFILLVTWWAMFIKGLMAVVPILLMLIGTGALIYFISEIKSRVGMGKEEASTSGEKKSE